MTAMPRTGAAPYALMAELESADALLEAARGARAEGFRRVEAYAPFPIEGLGEAVGLARTRVPFWTFIGGALGGVGGWFLQWYSAVVDYPINVGGRPLNSWPAFIPVVFEMVMLGAAFFAVVSMILGNGLPRLRHPVFNAPDFDLATRNRFFIGLVADADFDEGRARGFLERLGPMRIMEVPW